MNNLDGRIGCWLSFHSWRFLPLSNKWDLEYYPLMTSISKHVSILEQASCSSWIVRLGKRYKKATFISSEFHLPLQIQSSCQDLSKCHPISALNRISTNKILKNAFDSWLRKSQASRIVYKLKRLMPKPSRIVYKLEMLNSTPFVQTMLRQSARIWRFCEGCFVRSFEILTFAQNNHVLNSSPSDVMT